MSDPTNPPTLAEARKALAASSVPFRHREWWEAWCNGDPEHMLASTAGLPDGEREVRPERWETMFHHCDECDAETDRRGWDLADPEPFAVDIRRREWDYPAHENQVDARHLRVALAEVDRLTVERDESWAEMDAVHSLLSLRGVVTTDHYRHVGARRSMLPRVLEVVDARDAVLSDVAAAAGELRVPIPTPGTDAARLLLANVAMRRERDAYKRAKEENDDRFMTERDAARRERDTALADLSALRIEHEAHTILLDCARRERDEARARVAELESHNAELRTHDASVIKAQARGFEAGVKAAAHTLVATADKCKIASRPIRDGFMVGICEMHAAILALLEPKP